MDYIKISHIGVINLLREKIGMDRLDFDKARKLSEKELEAIRDNILLIYNRNIKEQEG